MSELEAYLGSGVSYPWQLVNGSARIVQGRDVLVRDLIVLLSTDTGTRYFLPEYGCRLSELMFEPNDEIFKTLARQFIFEAIAEWEKRAKFVGAEFEIIDQRTGVENVSEAERSRVDITISVEILSSNEVNSFVYPFYREIKF